MATGITFWCDVGNEYGTCPQRISVLTTDLAEACAVAIRSGWELSAAGDRCALYHAAKPDLAKPVSFRRRSDRRR